MSISLTNIIQKLQLKRQKDKLHKSGNKKIKPFSIFYLKIFECSNAFRDTLAEALKNCFLFERKSQSKRPTEPSHTVQRPAEADCSQQWSRFEGN